MDIELVRLRRTSFETAVKFDRRAFKRAVEIISKTVRKSETIGLTIEKGSSDLVVSASQKISAPCIEEKPRLTAYAVIHDVENAVPLNITISKKEIRSYLKEVICNGKQKMAILRTDNSLLYLCFGDDPQAQREKLQFKNEGIGDLLYGTGKMEWEEAFQVEDFAAYFLETKHVIDDYDDSTSLSYKLLADADNHIMVIARGGRKYSFRGNGISNLKYSCSLPSREILWPATLLDETVSICLSSNADYVLIVSGNVNIIMPLSSWETYSEKLISEVNGQKPYLMVTVSREKLLNALIPDAICHLSVKGTELLSEVCGEETCSMGIRLHIEKSPRDADVSCYVNGCDLHNALRSIHTHDVKIFFLPSNRLLMIRDLHTSARRLPHSLPSTEFIPCRFDS